MKKNQVFGLFFVKMKNPVGVNGIRCYCFFLQTRSIDQKKY